jgi:hypothetical protein
VAWSPRSSTPETSAAGGRAVGRLLGGPAREHAVVRVLRADDLEVTGVAR